MLSQNCYLVIRIRGSVTWIRTVRPRKLGSISGIGKNFFPFQKVQRRFEAHTASYLRGTRGAFPPDLSGRRLKLTSHLLPVPKIWMCWVITTLRPTPFLCIQEQLYLLRLPSLAYSIVRCIFDIHDVSGGGSGSVIRISVNILLQSSFSVSYCKYINDSFDRTRNPICALA